MRPRKSPAGSGANSEKVEFKSVPSHREDGERRAYGSYEHRTSERTSRDSSGEHRSHGGYRSSGPGERHGYNHGGHSGSNAGWHGGYGAGEHRRFGSDDHRESGQRRQFKGNGGFNHYGERGQFEERHHSGDNDRYENDGVRRSFGEGRPAGDRRNGTERDGRTGFGRKEGFGQRGFGKSRSYGPRDRKPRPTFTKESNEGISRMILRRPVVNDSETDEKAPETIQDVMRLNKFIANSGVCSRREADTLIQAGVVTVNGEVVTELGTKVNVFEDDIRFNGERLRGEEKIYLIMNKPKGFVTTASDPHADRTVLDLVKNCTARVYPVGRLDKNTTGVLMLTNDGEIAERLTHPSYDKKKIYQVILDHPLSQEDFDKILSGITLSDGDVAADELEYIDDNDKRKLGIEIHSGKNRIVRRIFESLGYDVRALDRVYFAGLTKKGLKKGEWRYLTEGEVNILKMGAYL